MTLFQRFKRLTFWNKLGVIASIVGIFAFILTIITLPIFERSRPRPRFTLSLQITNPCAVEYNGSSFKSGIVDVSLRATDFQSVLAANIIYLPASSNFSKPFVAHGKLEPDGQLHLLTSQKEFEESQK